MLDEAGFPKAHIVASNDLDEQLIASLKEQNAAIDIWGVGTRLVTAYDQPALGGVYKLSALREPNGPWRHKVKLSEQAIKVSTPGILQVRRYSQAGEAIGDLIFDELTPIQGNATMVDPLDPTRRKIMPDGALAEDLLVPIFSQGRRLYQTPTLEDSRRRLRDQLAMFHAGVKRFANPHRYPVGLELGLHDLKTALILEARGFKP